MQCTLFSPRARRQNRTRTHTAYDMAGSACNFPPHPPCISHTTKSARFCTPPLSSHERGGSHAHAACRVAANLHSRDPLCRWSGPYPPSGPHLLDRPTHIVRRVRPTPSTGRLASDLTRGGSADVRCVLLRPAEASQGAEASQVRPAEASPCPPSPIRELPRAARRPPAGPACSAGPLR